MPLLHLPACVLPVQEFTYLVKDKNQLAGLEETTLAVAAQKAIEAGYKGATAEGGPWLLTLDYTTYSAVVSFARNRELRKKFYIAYRRIAADGKTDNAGIIKQILKHRQDMSQMLSFKTYADQAFLSKVGWAGVIEGKQVMLCCVAQVVCCACRPLTSELARSN